MKKILVALAALVLCSSHDMFLKLDGFFLEPNTPAKIQLFNGTFSKSDNVIARSRMADCSLVGNGTRTAVDTTQWSERGDVTILNFTTGEAGTWVAGVSTKPRDFGMKANAFNDYLKHDGVLDMLKLRKEKNKLDQDVIERYSKHVKTIFQVGEERSGDWQTPLGYPIEFVPLSNPYGLHAGDELSVKLLWQGTPLAGELVYVDHEAATHGHDHDHDHASGHDHADGAAHAHEHKHAETEDEHHHASALQHRTDDNGTFTFEVTEDGTWQIRTIYLVESDAPEITHESNWATLTFALDHGQKHSHATADHHHGHDHNLDHDHEAGIPAYVYWGVSLLLIGGMFLYFNRKG